MLNEKDLQQAIDRRLSGLTASDARKMRIREEVKQRREDKPVKKKLTLITAVAIAVMMMASVAVAAGLGLFGELAGISHDERMPYLDAASTYINQSFQLTEDTWPPAMLTVNQAYYDGARVFISYTITGPVSKSRIYEGKPEQDDWDDIDENTIFAEEWSSDDPEVQAMFKALDGTAPRWGRDAHIGVHDGLQLKDGTYLDIIGGSEFREGDTIIGWKECIVPAEAAADVLTVQIGSYMADTIYYQEGRTAYTKRLTGLRDTTVWHSFTVKKDAANSVALTGSVDAGEWSAAADMTLSAVDIRGEVTVKAPESWSKYWWNSEGEAPDMIEDWLVYVDGVPVEGYNLQGGNGPGEEGELVFYICYQHVDPSAEIKLIPRFWNSGDKPEWAIVLKVAE